MEKNLCNNLKITFIVVSYNEAKYINEAINSILNLNINYDYEIIIGDDGSDDGSIDIIKDWKNKYPNIIKYFVMDREKGLSAKDVIGAIRCSNVIKKVLEVASGEFFLMLSADDYYINNSFINEDIDFMDKNKEFVALIHDGYNLNKNIQQEYFDYPKSLFWSREYLHISNFFIRNDKNLKNNLLTYFCDDTGMCYSILKTSKVKYKNNKIFEYRKNDTGITLSSDENELMLMEIMLYQDIINNKEKLRFANISRFNRTLRTLYFHKKEISSEKYKKYIDHLKNNKNDIYTKYINSSTVYRFFYFIKAYIIIVYFYIWRKVWRIL